jgi:Family of unknown function (DUF5670)
VWGTLAAAVATLSQSATPGQPANTVNSLQIRLGALVAFERSQQHDFSDSREVAMLWTIAVILLVLWALGMITSYTVGGVVHLLLVIALVVILFQFIGGRRSI